MTDSLTMTSADPIVVYLVQYRSAVKKARLAYSVFILIGAMALTIYPFWFLGIPTAFTCNMRSWFVNGAVALMTG